VSVPKTSVPVAEADLGIVSGQLGRTARDVTGVAVRCPYGRPAVIESAPTLAGKPNPNLLYLTCPTATVAISTIEAAGGVRRFKDLVGADAELRRSLGAVVGAYKQRRAALAPDGDPRPEAGIGGPAGPEKASCLHAYTAALLAARASWLDGEACAGADEAWSRFLPPPEALWCTDDRCARWAAGDQTGASHAGSASPVAGAQRVAAIDIGTISVRLLVADVRDGRPEQVFRRAEITRLGEGLLAGEPLNGAAKGRTAVVVAEFMAEARRLGAERILVAGTSACRDAADGAEFVRGLGEEHSARAVVLSGSEEASLAYAGACLDVSGRPVVLDVGGGSTELIRGTPGAAIESVSLALGASRGTERWIHADPPLPEEMNAALAEAAAQLEPACGAFAGTDRLVGVAGTVTTLACVDAGLTAYDAEVIHLRPLSLESIDRLIGFLAGMTTSQRAALPCVQSGRAPVIVAGALIVKAAMQALGYEEMTISERDILDGLALAAAC
jgi:exopolyphosphatase / guanosine-5'-triphosphate,3'-diphosphate pyrophosphatase